MPVVTVSTKKSLFSEIQNREKYRKASKAEVITASLVLCHHNPKEK